MRILCVAAALCALAAPSAAFESWSYKDWFVFTDTSEGGRVVECTAQTGPDGGPFIRVITSDADTKPPGLYPAVGYLEPGLRGVPTDLQDGDRVRFVLDDGRVFEAIGAATLTSEGIPQGLAMMEFAGRQPLLQAMRNGRRVDVMRGSEMLLGASLSGFTAAYGKLAEQCRFPTVGVID